MFDFMTKWKRSQHKTVLASVAAALVATAALSAPDCEHWLTTTTGWVCLADSTWFVRELPKCPAGSIWRVTQGDVQQLWECAA